MTIRDGDLFKIRPQGGVWRAVATAVPGVFAFLGPDRQDDFGPFTIREGTTGRLELHDDAWLPDLWIGLKEVARIEPID